MSSVTLSAPEIHCNRCKETIEAAVTPLDGVSSAVVDVDSRTVTVQYDEPANVAVVSAAMSEAGFDVAGIVAES